jgi:hypothetical protein
MLTRENLAADSVVDRQNKSGVLAEYTLFIPQAVLPISVEVGPGRDGYRAHIHQDTA